MDHVVRWQVYERPGEGVRVGGQDCRDTPGAGEVAPDRGDSIEGMSRPEMEERYRLYSGRVACQVRVGEDLDDCSPGTPVHAAPAVPSLRDPAAVDAVVAFIR